jgi:hypothetical protein
MSKDINRLNEEKVINFTYKAKVLGDIMEKIKQSVNEIEEGKPLIAKKLAYRDTAPYHPLSGMQDIHYPQSAELSYDNYLAAILDRSNHYEYNFTFSNG